MYIYTIWIYIYGFGAFSGPQDFCQSTCLYVQMMLLSDAIASLSTFLPDNKMHLCV